MTVEFYVSVMFFEGWELEYTNAWTYHPFNGPNNVNGIFTDPALDFCRPISLRTCPPPRVKTSKVSGRHIMEAQATWAPA